MASGSALKIMKFRTSRSDTPELNLVPLIDVLLMTLIFLVVTTSFSKETQLRIKLPEAAAQTKATHNTLRVLVDAGGHYFIDDKQLSANSAAALRSAMMAAAKGRKDPVIIIHADSKTAHEAVVRIMEVARQLGFTRLSFATQRPAQDARP